MRIKHNLLAILIILPFTLSAQSIERQVIGSAGTILTDGTTTLSFTVGEVAITTLTDGTTTLNQGFHQASVKLLIKINPIVVLQGAALNPNFGEETLMRDDLRAGYLPTTSPYTDALTCDISVFNQGGSSETGPIDDDIVDWIFIELRDKNDNSNVLASQSALLQRDGDIVSIDGISEVDMRIKADEYYIAIKHRNHLGIMSLNTWTLSETTTTIDFTDANNQITYGANAQSIFGMPTDIVAMWSGDLNGDAKVRYAGSGNDATDLKDAINAYPTNTSMSNFFPYYGYDNLDLNLNGQVRFLGSGNDSSFLKDLILSYSLNTSGSNFFPINQQIPN